MTALAADIGRSVAANLGGSAGGATATCVWREADPAKADFVRDKCGSSKILLHRSRLFTDFFLCVDELTVSVTAKKSPI